MKLPSRNIQFLARDGYRMRRLMDAARILPVIGFVLLLLPLMRQGAGTDSPPTASEAVYLFVVWIGLVVTAFVMSLGLRRTLGPPRPPVGPLPSHQGGSARPTVSPPDQ
ncbi:hypothetical protein [Roseinatronobacter sp. NSM]|uniref:hypothetical protein n=1 Tax=Roseinatronobacter sp. NSM TaxID=3457785 RepID=UPI004036A195